MAINIAKPSRGKELYYMATLFFAPQVFFSPLAFDLVTQLVHLRTVSDPHKMKTNVLLVQLC